MSHATWLDRDQWGPCAIGCGGRISRYGVGMLLERGGDLEALDGLIDGITSTGGRVVLIRGEAGIGKSALINAFVDGHLQDAHAFYGTCDDLFIPQPLGPFWDYARSEPSLREPLDKGDRPGLLGRILDLLSRSGRPTVLVMEDTHWADEATLDAIRHIGRRIDRTNGLLLLTYRDGEVDYDHPLRRVMGDIPAQNMARIQLAPLTLSAVSTLTGGKGLDAREVMRVTDGNPFLVVEMTAGVDGEAIPSSLHDAIMARASRLTAGSQQALRSLSVIPEPIPLEDAVLIDHVERSHVDECDRRGLLDVSEQRVAFRHDLIRRTIESALTPRDRTAMAAAALDALSEETHPSLLIDLASEVGDVDRLVELAPRSARYAAAAGGHIQAVDDFRAIGPHLDRLDPDELGPILEEWAAEEYLVGEEEAAISVVGLACTHYETIGDTTSQSRALAQEVRYLEWAGMRTEAESSARQAVAVLGPDSGGPALARAMEAETYLQMMAGNVAAVPGLVERTIEVGGPGILEQTLIRSLNHKGTVTIGADHRHGHESLEQARQLAEAAGLWEEACRALTNMAWGAAEDRDVEMSADLAREAIATAERHELPGSGRYARAILARAFELRGEWDEAADIARGLIGGTAGSGMTALPILGLIEARRGRSSAVDVLMRGWELAVATSEFQRVGPAAIALAEWGWMSGDMPVPIEELAEIMSTGLEQRASWSSGKLAFWLWEFGELSRPPPGIAEPYRLSIEGAATQAAAIWASKEIPYERALALMHGETSERLEAIEVMESLGATAPAARLRKELRDEGVSVPRGKGRRTRRHVAGLTGRQAEVLELLDEGLKNPDIADRLFLSPRTVENHVSAVLDKLDVGTRDEAVALARADGLLPDRS